MSASDLFPKLPSSWQEESFTVLDQKVFVRLYRSEDISKGRLLLLVHGQSEQSNRYEHFPHYLQGTVDAIACVDLPGHGKSAGIRGHIESFQDYSQAVLAGFHTSYDWMKKKAGHCTAHWFGHSLGGLITLRTLFRETTLPLNSVTISSPLLGLAIPVPPLKKFFGELVEPVLGSLKLDNELGKTVVSHDPSIAEGFAHNPLNHHFVTPRFFVHMQKEIILAQQNRGPFAYNLMETVALADTIVDWKAEYDFFLNLKMKEGKQKHLVSFPNFYHESFNEIGKEIAFVALNDWIRKFS